MKKSQLENLVREALAENENAEIANALKDALGDLGDEIKQNSDDLVQGDEDLNEAGILMAAGLVLSGPEIVKIIGQVTEKLSKLLGNSGATGEKIISIADKLHHILVALIEKPLNLVPGIKKSGKAHNLAIHILNLVVAGLFVKGGITMGAKFAARKFSAASLKAAMNAVKGKEITAYLKNMLGKGDNVHEDTGDTVAQAKDLKNQLKKLGVDFAGIRKGTVNKRGWENPGATYYEVSFRKSNEERTIESEKEILDQLNIPDGWSTFWSPLGNRFMLYKGVDGPTPLQYIKAVDLRFKGQEIEENFQDGKKKGKSRPGRVKRAGASCNGSVTDLRRKAKNASGEKAKMYHWCANMKSGKKKK